MCGAGLGSAQGGCLRWRTLGVGSMDTQLEILPTVCTRLRQQPQVMSSTIVYVWALRIIIEARAYKGFVCTEEVWDYCT